MSDFTSTKRLLIFGGESDMAEPLLELYPRSIRCTRDVRSYLQVESEIVTKMPDAVVNLAGVSHVQRVKNSSIFQWTQENAVNLRGSYHIARASLFYKKDIPMVFVASVAGLYGKAEHSGYSASKAGVISLVQSLGMEGHRAFAVSPGRVNTKMRERDYPGEDIRTRLTTMQVAEVIRDCIEGQYQPGDNVIIRKIGFDTHMRIDAGAPWRDYLAVKAIHEEN